MPYEYKEYKECIGCKYNDLDAYGSDSWHCSLELSMLGNEEGFIEELKKKCKRFRLKFEE